MSEHTAMKYRRVILGASWLVTVLPCAFCLFTGDMLTRAGRAIARAHQAVHVWANPGAYPRGKL